MFNSPANTFGKSTKIYLSMTTLKSIKFDSNFHLMEAHFRTAFTWQ